MPEFKVLEIFSSISGEAQRAGELTTFVRLSGCNLCCAYCDTRNMLIENNFNIMSISDIIQKCKDNNHRHVILTGGEPLNKPDIEKLIAELLKNDFEVEIETNGTQSFITIKDVLNVMHITEDLISNLSFTIDYKMGFSGMEEFMNPEVFENLSALNENDTIKFVVAENDIEHCMDLIEKFQKQGTKCKYYISPVFGEVEMSHIIDAMKKHNLNNDVRFQLQIHKYVWDPNKTGV